MNKTPWIFDRFNFEHFTRIWHSAGKEKADEYRLSFRNKAVSTPQEEVQSVASATIDVGGWSNKRRQELIEELKGLWVKAQWLHFLTEEKLLQKIEEARVANVSTL